MVHDGSPDSEDDGDEEQAAEVVMEDYAVTTEGVVDDVVWIDPLARVAAVTISLDSHIRAPT